MGGGKKVGGTSGRFGDIFNPATGEVSGRVPFASADEVRAAIAAADAAFPAWSRTPPAKRAQVLFALRTLLHQHLNELAELTAADHGKTLTDAKGSVTRGIEVIEFACGIPQLLKGEISENVAGDVDPFAIRQPVGICAGITPFNFPAMVPMWMFPLAIACGNTFILKPSEKVPSCALRLAELAKEAGLPDGVLNVVNGDREAVETLLTDPRIAAISFVGSTPVGEHIYRTGCAHGKRVQALCGAKNHMVVMPDADMDQAVDAVMGAAYGSAGERCMAISVLVTVGDVADRLLPKIQERIRKLKVAPGTEPGAEMGPLVTKDHHAKVVSYVEKGEQEGAKLLEDGRKTRIPGHEQGFFLGPCLFDGVKPQMSIYTDEIFGPVLSVVRTGSYDEALGLVNANRYANGVAIFTNDGGAARRFQNEVQVGMVGVNVPIPVPLAYYSFGGWKSSLFGDSHVHGREGIHFYTRGKVVTSRWPDPHHRGVNLGFPQMK